MFNGQVLFAVLIAIGVVVIFNFVLYLRTHHRVRLLYSEHQERKKVQITAQRYSEQLQKAQHEFGELIGGLEDIYKSINQLLEQHPIRELLTVSEGQIRILEELKGAMDELVSASEKIQPHILSRLIETQLEEPCTIIRTIASELNELVQRAKLLEGVRPVELSDDTIRAIVGRMVSHLCNKLRDNPLIIPQR